MLQLLHTPIVILHAIVCVLVMLVVLIQPGKSGGLGAALGGAGAQQIFGGRGAGNFLTRTTWISATVFFVTSITLAYISTSTGDSLQNLKSRKAQAADVSSVPVSNVPDSAKADGAAAAAPSGDAPASGKSTPAAPASGSNSAPASPGSAPTPAAPAQP